MNLQARLEKESRLDPATGCLLWEGTKGKDGYGRLCLSKRKRRLTHRLAWESIFGPIPDGLCILHHCDTPACINPYHLFPGTQLDNVVDRNAKGRTSCGEARPEAKLTNAEVLAIRVDTRRDGIIAKEYGISSVLVSHIQCRRKWKHL